MARVRADIDWHGGQASVRTRRAALQGLQQAADHLLAKSRQVVPLEDGTLERSGKALVDPAALTAAVTYDTPYALRQHEELTWQHAPGRTSKYLERPHAEESETMQALIAAQIRRALRG